MKTADENLAAAGGLRPLVNHDGFRNLATGQVVSGIGDWMATLAIMVLVHDISGSSAAVGAVLVLRLLPTVLAGPLVARAVRRWDRRSMMLAMDAARAGIVVLFPFVHALWWVYLWAFMLELAGMLFLPARDAAVPDLAHRDALPLANGVMLGASYGTIPIGAMAFGIVSWFGGGGAPAMVFVVDAATFLVSYAFISRVHLVDRRDWDPDAEGGRFRDAFRLPIVRTVGPAAVACALGLGTLFSIGVEFVQDTLEASTFGFGVLVALFGAGAAIGLSLLTVAGRSDVGTVRFCLAAQGIVVALMSQVPTLWAAYIGAVMFGAATAAGLATAMSVLQARLDERDRLLAFVAFHVLIRGGLAIAALGAGLASDFLGRLEWPLIGAIPPARGVLFASGVLVAVASFFVRPPEEISEAESAT